MNGLRISHLYVCKEHVKIVSKNNRGLIYFLLELTLFRINHMEANRLNNSNLIVLVVAKYCVCVDHCHGYNKSMWAIDQL